MYKPKYWAFQVALALKNLSANAGDRRDKVQSLGWEDYLEAWQPTPVFILGKIPYTRGAWRAAVHGVSESVTEHAQHGHAFLSMEFFMARMLEWLAISSFRGPRDQACISCVSCIACRFFIH